MFHGNECLLYSCTKVFTCASRCKVLQIILFSLWLNKTKHFTYNNSFPIVFGMNLEVMVATSLHFGTFLLLVSLCQFKMVVVVKMAAKILIPKYICTLYSVALLCAISSCIQATELLITSGFPKLGFCEELKGVCELMNS